MKHIILIILLTLGIWAEEVGVPYVPEIIYDGSKNFPSNNHISHLQYVNSENMLISGDNNGTVSFISLSPLRVVKQIHAHEGSITAMTLTPDNKYVITSGEDKTLKLWDIKSYVQVGKFDTKNIPIYGAVVTHDGKRLITADICSNISYWDMKTFEKKGEYPLEEQCLQYYKKRPTTVSLMFQDMKLSHDSKRVAIANSRRISFNRYPDEDIFIIDIVKNQLVSSGWIGGEVLYAGDIAFSNDDKYIIFPSMYKKNERGEYVQDFTKSSQIHTRFDIHTKEIILETEPLGGNFISSDDGAWLISIPRDDIQITSTKYRHTATKYLQGHATSNIIFGEFT